VNFRGIFAFDEIFFVESVFACNALAVRGNAVTPCGLTERAQGTRFKR